MNWKDAVSLAGSNLRQTPVRAVLTTMGVVIGIGMLVCMVAFGLGLKKLATDQVRKFAFLNTITVFPKFQRTGPGRRSKEQDPPAVLDDRALETMAGMPGIYSATPMVVFPVMMGTPPGEISVMGRSLYYGGSINENLIQLSMGSFFSGDFVQEIIVHEDTIPALGFEDPSGALNQTVRLSFFSPQLKSGSRPMPGLPAFSMEKKQMDFKVVGILKKQEGIFGNSLLRELLMPLGTVKDLGLHQLSALQSLIRNPRNQSLYVSAEIRVEEGANAVDVEDAVKKLGFRTFSLQSILKEMNQFFLIMNSILGVVGSIALLVAALGIANTMIITILERRREIGIMKAVGSTRRAIRKLFFVESSLIGFMGGVLGFFLGWATSRLLNFLINLYIKSQGGREEVLFHFPPWLLAASTLFAIAVALAAALYPASRAARLDPVEALRYE